MELILNFQHKVSQWIVRCFGGPVSMNRKERNFRFLEEALELVQSLDCKKSDALLLVDYVYSRPIGEPWQEVGGVMVTLAALCNASAIDLDTAATQELTRCENFIEKIRAKQARKVRDSALPGSSE